jgi:beta-N-acetylhexosaminidase
MSENSTPKEINLESNDSREAPLGPLMLDVAGLALTEQERQILKSPVVGGLILFSRNYSDPVQLKALVAEIRTCSPGIIIAVDHEGGRVQRFREGFTSIPPMQELGRQYLDDQVGALEKAFDYGWIIASELIAYDIDISFTPVLDRDYGVSSVIGDRAFSDDIDALVALSGALIKGMRNAGMASTGKHFPGHGAVVADSHIDIPRDTRPYDEIVSKDMCVFERLAKEGLDAVMPAHVIYTQVDDQPAGFSSVWMQDVLRQKLGFDGVIFSDDLSMEGASVAGSYTDRTDAALSAGCDMVLVCNQPVAAQEVREYLESLVAEGSLALDNSRLARMRYERSKRQSIEQVQGCIRWQQYNK